ncbi:hypothetical protein [Cupriavidus oxalaticus]
MLTIERLLDAQRALCDIHFVPDAWFHASHLAAKPWITFLT